MDKKYGGDQGRKVLRNIFLVPLNNDQCIKLKSELKTLGINFNNQKFKQILDSSDESIFSLKNRYKNLK